MVTKLVRNLLLSASIALPVASLIGLPAWADQRIRIWNNTDLVMTHLYISSSASNSWGRDLLSTSDLESGETFDVNLTSGSNRCAYDIKAVYEDGSWDQWMQADICRQTFFRFWGAGGEYR